MEERYNQYTVADFAADEDFIRWVKNPSQADIVFWEQWISQHPTKASSVKDARILIEAVQFPEYPNLKNSIDQVWRRIENSRQYSTRPLPTTFEEEEVHPSSSVWWKIAATFTGLLMMAGIAYYFVLPKNQIYQTAYGETRRVVLPDGSIATLNGNSSLELGKWEDQREVWLEGEAYFSVQKREDEKTKTPIKFIVHTSDVDVNVLGTQFTVSDHQQTRVVLNEGKIELMLIDKKERIVMQPGDLIEIDKGDKQLVKRTVNPVVYSSWKDNEWILDGISLKEIAKRLEDTYGLKVVVKKDPDPAVKVTGVVPTDDLDKLLIALSTVFNMEFKRQGNEVIIE
ncbi:FecR family protein [Pseudochryseolinea flava]|uniref:FecR protein domain-containing protein n=1 Tax=Pseudochryseolinea flava TaxID=2059302 RepID=A0A364XWT3_9BACT|nr:FecR domain-containing protein [Pseudochryseolinea flava]RAV98215.1 hypothetical protein DQQ10_24735 [Pseudochryseolinea flava]